MDRKLARKLAKKKYKAAVKGVAKKQRMPFKDAFKMMYISGTEEVQAKSVSENIDNLDALDGLIENVNK